MPVTLAIIGAGSRGRGYASFAETFPERAKVVAVAEPREEIRHALAQAHQIPPERQFSTWEQAARLPKFADAVVIATQDRMHTAPALAFAEKGWHILLEKPMAPTEAECRDIVAAVKRAGIHFAVGHVLRYTRYTRQLKAILQQGRLGRIVSIQHLEPVGYWHQAHSFVRGNWSSTAQSTFMLMAKSCHDLDWLRHLMAVPCRAVSSFGGLFHFRAENRPPGAAERCLDCSVAAQCPYDARAFYLERLRSGKSGWPVDVLTPNPTEDTLLDALRHGPYGRCVYACDNDVVDHQVVNLEFATGATASFTMTAFNEAAPRITKIFGTRGELSGDGRILRLFDFLTDGTEEIDTDPAPASGVLSGHGGGDFGLMDAFIAAIESGDASRILSGPDETLESHLIAFASERARLQRTVESIPTEVC
ncbi:MAG: Gfo/Idh/MocA family oxidoreductase [Verrucomicrobiales bacterium]|nr:Gfo/Idh/MocA family oxidoreductase [Verrucomicrobiales bacterium]